MGAGILKTKTVNTDAIGTESLGGTGTIKDEPKAPEAALDELDDLKKRFAGREYLRTPEEAARMDLLEKRSLFGDFDQAIAERNRVSKLNADNAAKDQELAPLKKSLTDEVDFLGKRFGISSKIGGRGVL